MSYPTPNTSAHSSNPTLSQSEQEEWDAPLIALAQKSKGDIRKLLTAFHSFLHRRTDFYALSPTPTADAASEEQGRVFGFKEGEAEKLLLASFRQFPLRRVPKKQSKAPASDADDAKKNDKQEISSPNPPATTSPAPSQPKKVTKKKSIPDGPGNLMEGIRYSESGKQIPVGNGGSTPVYQFTQNIYETSVIVPIPLGTKAKDLNVKLHHSSISVQWKSSKEFILNGTLPEKIRADESTWSLEGGSLLLTLDKRDKKWWSCAIEGDEEIDTALVDSSSKIGEYDEVTQGMIRKILFDQRQEKLGLPTSEDMGKSNEGVQFLDSTLDPTKLPKGSEYIGKKKMEELMRGDGGNK